MIFRSTITRITDFIREIYRQLFGRNTNSISLYSSDSLVSEEMARHLTFIEDLYENNYKRIEWLESGKVKSLRLATVIPREISRIVCSEADIKISGESDRAEYLNAQLEIFLEKLPVYVEQGAALGNIAFKPYIQDGNIYISVSRLGGYIPIKINGNGIVTACIFVERLTKDNELFTRLEYHHIENTGQAAEYIIENTAYRSGYDGVLGRQISLEKIPEWKEYSPVTKVSFTGEPVPLYAIYTNPFANSIDIDSSLGVSIISDCIDLIREADEMWELVTYEMKSGERKVFANSSVFSKLEGMERLSRFYKTVEFDSDDLFHDYTPPLRNEFIESRVQSIFKRIEQNAGLSFGTISDPMSVSKTATEIKYSNHRLHVTVSSIQSALKKCMVQLVEAMNTYCDLYNITSPGDYQLICNWDDSVIESKEDKQARAMLQYQSGLIDETEYFVIANGMTENEAEEYVKKIRARQPTAGGQNWFEGSETL